MAISRVSQSTVKEGLEKSTSFFAGIPPVLGRYESIATVMVGSGGSSSIEFTSIPGTYQHLQIRGIARDSSTSGSLRIRPNGDTGNNFARHVLYGDGSSAFASGASGDAIGALGDMPISSSTTNNFGSAIVDILDYASTTKNKTIRSFSGFDNNGSGQIQLRSILWASTNAITSIAIFFPSTNLAQHSTFALYGIKAP